MGTCMPNCWRCCTLATGSERVRAVMVFVLVSLNLGGLCSLILQFGRAQWLDGLGTAGFVVGLNAIGFWLLRAMRED